MLSPHFRGIGFRWALGLTAACLLAVAIVSWLPNAEAPQAESVLPVAFPSSPQQDLPYRLDAPDVRFELPEELDEISGLTVLDDTHLGAIQDEEGILFILDLQTSEVLRRIQFAGDNDYEGVEVVGRTVYVLKSNGTLYRIEDWRRDDPDVKKFATWLKPKHDTEGLGYDPATGLLYVACKEYPGSGFKQARAIYTFDPATEEMATTPSIVMDTRAFAEYYAEATGEDVLDRFIRRVFAPIADLSGFKPSALAMHPITGEWYILSSEREALVRLSSRGNIMATYVLPKALYAQPEGIAFLPNGDMFISNERGRGPANLLRFRYRGDS